MTDPEQMTSEIGKASLDLAAVFHKFREDNGWCGCIDVKHELGGVSYTITVQTTDNKDVEDAINQMFKDHAINKKIKVICDDCGVTTEIPVIGGRCEWCGALCLPCPVCPLHEDCISGSDCACPFIDIEDGRL